MMVTNIELLGFTCSNPDVREACREELFRFPTHPYVPRVLSARDLFQYCRGRFGDLACIDFLYYEN